MAIPKILKISLYLIGAFVVLIGGMGVWAYQYRDDLFRYIVKEANQHINGRVSIKDFGFTPFANGIGFTFSLFGVQLQDTAFVRHQTKLLSLEQLTLEVDARKLLNKELKITSVCLKEGKISVFVDSNGYSNLSVFNQINAPDTTQVSSQSPMLRQIFGNLKEVCLKDVAFSLQNSPKNQRIGFTAEDLTNKFSQIDSLWKMKLKGEVYFEGLAFNVKRGAFLENKNTTLDLELVFNPDIATLQVLPSSVHVFQDAFSLQGSVDFSSEGHIKLQIDTDTIAAPRALAILPKTLEKKISQFEILPIVTGHVFLDAPLRQRGTDPLVVVDFQTHTFEYQSPIGPLSEVIATGHFTNQVDSLLPIGNQNSHIVAKNVSALFNGVIPMNTAFTVSDLDEPKLVMEGNFRALLKECNDLIDERNFKLISGTVGVDYCYEGSMNPIFDSTTKQLNGKLDGHAKLENGAFVYLPHRLSFSGMNSGMRFNGKKVEISYLHLKHQKNQIKMSGKVEGLLPYAFNSTGKVIGDIAVFTPDLGLDWIRNYQHAGRSNGKFFTQLVDKILSHLELKTLLLAKKVHYRNFQAENVKGKVYLSEKAIRCENVRMNAFGGTFEVTGGINNFNQAIHQLYAKGRLNNANVQKVFYGFENFGQETVSDRNLKGKISATFSYSSQLNKNFKLIPSTMNGRLAFELVEAELNHFEPLKKMQRVFFKRRNFDNVRFERLQNEFVLQGQEINMAQMKIASSVLTFFVGGTYSFGTKTDLLVHVPLSNLKRDDNDEQHIIHDLNGRNLIIRAIEEEGEVKLKYHLDWRKKQRNVL